MIISVGQPTSLGREQGARHWHPFSPLHISAIRCHTLEFPHLITRAALIPPGIVLLFPRLFAYCYPLVSDPLAHVT